MEPLDPAARPVLVLDFGAQYVQLIARRVRERHAFARIVRHDITPDRVRELNPLALILSGGPMSVYEPGAPHCDPALFGWGFRYWESVMACSSRPRPWEEWSRPTPRASLAGPSAGF